MQKIASAIIVAAIALVAVVFGIAALSSVTSDAVDGTVYEGAFDTAQLLSNGAVPILFVSIILIVVGALILALKTLVTRGSARSYGRGRRGY